MTDTPEYEIARFLRQLKWLAVVAVAVWLVWLLAPILTPFVWARCWAGPATRWWIACSVAVSPATWRWRWCSVRWRW